MLKPFVLDIVFFKGKYMVKNKYASIILMLVLVVVWEISVIIFSIPMYVLPSPIDVINALINDFSDIIKHSTITFYEAAIGMVIALILATIISILMDKFTIIRDAIYPILVVTQTVPIIVLAPIFVIYLGFGLLPKIVTVVLMCFFPIVVSFSDGLINTDIEYVNLAKSYGSSDFKIYKLIKIPSAMPNLFSGLKVSATYSISGAVVGEWVSAKEGLGYYLIKTKNAYMLDNAFASVLMIILLSLFMNLIIKIIILFQNPQLRKSL